ncbi:hypothetical protein ACF0H5_022390 [Mactra antiquata]
MAHSNKPSPWSSGASQNSPMTSLNDVMKEQQIDEATSPKPRNREGFKFVSSEPWYPGKVSRSKNRRTGSASNQSTEGTQRQKRPVSASSETKDIYPDYDKLSKLTGMRVVDVHKQNLVKLGYPSLVEWVKVPGHVYIGRDMTRYVPGAVGSKWHNPFKSRNSSREQSCRQFKEYIRSNKNLHDNGKTLYQSLEELKGMTLGCWCHPERCHGHMLMELVSETCDCDEN